MLSILDLGNPERKCNYEFDSNPEMVLNLIPKKKIEKDLEDNEKY